MSEQWLIDLVAEYTTTKGPPAPDKIKRLDRLFASEEPAAMLLAVNDYMRDGGRFFPRVADLVPYVKTATSLFGRVIRPDLLSEADRSRIDEAIYSYEVSMGTIDPHSSAEALSAARLQMAEMTVGQW